MRKPSTDESNVQMSDVLCDFCRREWTEDLPIVEGHQGSCICGNCLSVAFTEIVLNSTSTHTTNSGFACVMCLETGKDRQALGRENEPGWQSPLHPEAAICRRCVKQATGALGKDKDSGWVRPG